MTHAREFAAAFLFLHDLFRSPTPEQWRWLNSPEAEKFRSRLAEATGAGAAAGRAGLPQTAADYESQFIAAFDAGAPNPPVPLLESHYVKRDPVPRILHENILFYRSFGLRLRAGANETADHLRHQLEFTAHLYRLESAETEPGRLDQIRRARGDYLERHLLSWLGTAEEKAAALPFPWVRGNLTLTRTAARSAHEAFPKT